MGVWLVILAFFAGIPLAIWSTILPWYVRWFDTGNTWRSLGQLSGLIGMSFFAGSLLLSVRAKWLDKLFGGINLAYRDHHWLGTIGFCLLMMHPLALAYRLSLQSLSAAAIFLIPNPADWSVFLGIIALLFLMALLVMTYWWRPTYHLWFLSHKFMALAYAIGWWHLLTIDSDVSQSAALRWYYYILGLMSVAVIIYRVVGHRRLVPRAVYRVAKITALTGGLWDIYLQPVAKPLAGRAGQFAWFTFLSSGLRREAHPFSIAGIDATGGWRLVAKALGDQTKNLSKLAVGDRVLIEGPYGSFGSLAGGAEAKQLWIAGGIGITPFLSLAGHCSDKDSVVVIHSIVEPGQNIFAPEFSAPAANLKFIPWVSAVNGRLNAVAITREVPDWRARTILLCGPVPMMDSLRAQFADLGGDKSKIISEDFNLV